MSDKESEIREAEPVKPERKQMERRDAKSEIILVELKSVNDETSPIKAEDVKNMAEKIIEMFPSGIQLDNLVEATIITLKEVSKIYKLKAEHKIDLIVDILTYVIDNTDAGSLEVLDPILKKIIPGIIDNLLMVEDGKLVINKKTFKEKLSCSCFKN
jgi:hypothetical protein